MNVDVGGKKSFLGVKRFVRKQKRKLSESIENKAC